MSKILDYLNKFKKAEQLRIMNSAGTSLRYVRNCASANRPIGPAIAAAIELESRGEVMRWDLRPDDWHLIWPELKENKNAPEIQVIKTIEG
jgi:DNA-binding transcriptional regulator YdaS (Cro superfamily)